MNLPQAPNEYSKADQNRVREDLRREDLRNAKRDQNLQLATGAYVVLVSPNGTRYGVTVDNAGVLGTTAL